MLDSSLANTMMAMFEYQKLNNIEYFCATSSKHENGFPSSQIIKGSKTETMFILVRNHALIEISDCNDRHSVANSCSSSRGGGTGHFADNSFGASRSVIFRVTPFHFCRIGLLSHNHNRYNCLSDIRCCNYNNFFSGRYF